MNAQSFFDTGLCRPKQKETQHHKVGEMLEGFVISKLRPQRVLGIFSDPKQHDEENDGRSDLCEFQLRYLKNTNLRLVFFTITSRG